MKELIEWIASNIKSHGGLYLNKQEADLLLRWMKGVDIALTQQMESTDHIARTLLSKRREFAETEESQ